MKQYETKTNVIPNGPALNPYERERQDLAISLNKTGKAHYLSGNYKDALLSHEQALKIFNEIYAENLSNFDIAATLNNLGTAHNALGNYQESMEYHYQALEVYSKLSVYHHVCFETVIDHFNITYFGDYKEAMGYHAKKFYEAMSRFSAAADECPSMNAALHNYRFDFYGNCKGCPPDANLLDAIGFYRGTLCIQNMLDRFYEEEYSFLHWHEENSIANFIANNPD